MRLFVGERFAVVEQELGAHEPDAVAVAGLEVLELGDRGDVDQNFDTPSVPRHGGLAEEGGFPSPALGDLAPPHLEARALPAAGAEHDDARLAVDDGFAVAFERRVPEADHHRHSLRAGQHGDVARRASARQRDAAALAPVGLQETRRCDVVACEDGALRARAALPLAGKMPEHAVSQIAQVGGPRPEVVVFRRAVVGDLQVDGPPPRLARRVTARDGGMCRIAQVVVLEHRDLEGEDVGPFAADARAERRKLGDGRLDGGVERLPFKLGVAAVGPPRHLRGDDDHRPDRDPAGRRPPFQFKGLLHPHDPHRNRVRQVRRGPGGPRPHPPRWP